MTRSLGKPKPHNIRMQAWRRERTPACGQRLQWIKSMPTFYRIQIKELLDGHWAGWFEGMTITHAADGTTTLEGWFVDQAALYGLISKVRDLGLTLLA